MVEHVGGFATMTPRRDVHVIRAAGELDTVAGARLLRLVDARLHLLDLGQVTTAHILLDLSATRTASTGAIAGLKHATDAAARRGVGLHLVGAGALAAVVPLAARQQLGRFRSYPSVDVALDALDAGSDSGSDSGADSGARSSAPQDADRPEHRGRSSIRVLPAPDAVQDDPGEHRCGA